MPQQNPLAVLVLGLALSSGAAGLSGAQAAGASADSVPQSVPSSAAEVRPLLIGAPAPEVTLVSLDGSPVGLREVLAQQPTILVFYRGGW